MSPQIWAHHFACEPVVSNMSLLFHTWAHGFKHEPLISHVSLSFWMWAHHFTCRPVILNVSPSFWTWACHFKCDLWTTATSLTMPINATKPWSTGHINSRYNVGVFIRVLRKCNYLIYYHIQDWSCNCNKLHKTAMDWSMMVLVSVFKNLRKGGPVSVPVLSNMDEKLDWTRLPSTSSRVLIYMICYW